MRPDTQVGFAACPDRHPRSEFMLLPGQPGDILVEGQQRRSPEGSKVDRQNVSQSRPLTRRFEAESYLRAARNPGWMVCL